MFEVSFDQAVDFNVYRKDPLRLHVAGGELPTLSERGGTCDWICWRDRLFVVF